MSQATGLVAAVLSAVFNGSFPSLSKVPALKDLHVDEILFSTYVSMGVFLSSVIALAFLPLNSHIVNDEGAGTVLRFEPFGLLAGAILVGAFTFSFLAVPRVGVAIGQGVWSCAAMLISFMWGTVVNGDRIKSVGLAVAALFMLVIGGLGISLCTEVSKWVARKFPSMSESREAPTLLEGNAGVSERGGVTAEVIAEGAGHEGGSSAGRRAFGLVCALLVGVFGGSILLPESFITDKRNAGLSFVFWLGVGAAVFSLVVLGVHILVSSARISLDWRPALFGTLAGVVWNLGNVASVIGTHRVGYSVAYPIMQCSLLVGALWGILAFGEIKKQALPFFAGGAAVLLSGAVCLAFAVEPV
uniref:EamA domain-containing protein n=1 Tax=Chromera velia CCMP2878 TaxID=1169474 RepID=A0A0G4HNV1_9ALVE|eukprot:Cvel_29632.t1-p1 / transcript=Cvel_29632.t1 / gene=Cvel_29632 / organism=Chromera_velia_CCMP2878 / gene_product=hypothetical protein / transcript_product=hypothetical protein / location=Cvel_scaffold4090:3488-5102(-) / protein_length=357 / sequence_SO=supercontig / SO=protein_coding / is_pseudo=false